LLYVRDKYWIVVDRVTTDRPRQVDVLWHWHPKCEVTTGKRNVVFTNNEKGNLKVIPVGKQKWSVTMVKGQEKPEIQGWYSEEYNKYAPNTATIYSTKVQNSSVFVWILQPSEHEANSLKSSILSQTAHDISLRIVEDGASPLILQFHFQTAQKQRFQRSNFKWLKPFVIEDYP
jgi:hypothetical protein